MGLNNSKYHMEDISPGQKSLTSRLHSSQYIVFNDEVAEFQILGIIES